MASVIKPHRPEASVVKRPIPHKPVRLSKLGVDTECTGLDILHGCRPFMLSTCDEDENYRIWEWEVNPLTRTPIIPPKEKAEVQLWLKGRRLVFHHAKFDVRALASIGIELDWNLIEDTLTKHHVLASGEEHGLKAIGLDLLDMDDLDQKALRDAVIECRRIGKQLGWRIAAPFDPHFPAMKDAPKDGWYVMDMWLPREVARHRKLPLSHPYWSLCHTYNLRDTCRTVGVDIVTSAGLQELGYEHLYKTRAKLHKITYDMETQGVTVSLKRAKSLGAEFSKQSSEHKAICFKLAGSKLKNINSSSQVKEILHGPTFGIPVIKYTPPSTKYPDGQPKLDKEVITELLDTLPHSSKSWSFLDHLFKSRKCAKAAADLKDYRLRAIPHPNHKDFVTLHGNTNITGTDTVRFSHSNPNLGNISKKEDRKTGEDYNVRRAFGPAPGREWYSIDYSNIELRIFAYASGDKELIKAFESGYSVHLIVAEVVYPREWEEIQKTIKLDKAAALDAAKKGFTLIEWLRRETGKQFKKLYESTFYQWVKNGDFALIYGAGIQKADRTYHAKGAYHLIRKRFPYIDSFMQDKNEEAKQGFITTLGGYPLQVPRDRPHVAVNYFVQGSAAWCMVLAMIRVQEYLDALNESLGLTGYDCYQMILTVHDELDFDFPLHQRNHQVITQVALLMESSGVDIGIPTPVEIERHANNWAEGKTVVMLA